MSKEVERRLYRALNGLCLILHALPEESRVIVKDAYKIASEALTYALEQGAKGEWTHSVTIDDNGHQTTLFHNQVTELGLIPTPHQVLGTAETKEIFRRLNTPALTKVEPLSDEEIYEIVRKDHPFIHEDWFRVTASKLMRKVRDHYEGKSEKPVREKE